MIIHLLCKKGGHSVTKDLNNFPGIEQEGESMKRVMIMMCAKNHVFGPLKI